MEQVGVLMHHSSLNPILYEKSIQKIKIVKTGKIDRELMRAYFVLPISMLCLPGIIGGGGTLMCDGMPGFFFNVAAIRVCDDLTGCDAMLAHVVFFGCAADAVFDWLFVFAVYESR